MSIGDRLQDLQVGESFVHSRSSLKVSVYVSHWAKRHDRKFKTRRVEFGRYVLRVA